MNKNLISSLIHVPVWVIAILVAYFFSLDDVPMDSLGYVYNPNYTLFSTLDFSFWFLGSFYVFYSFLVPKYLEKRKMIRFWGYSLVFVLLLMPVIVLLSVQVLQLTGSNLSELFTYTGFLQWIACAAGTLFCGGLGLLYRFSFDWFQNLQLRMDMESIKLQSELNAIKSRLNPHFLFNTLNNIDTLIQVNPEKASAVLTQLSDLLRYAVYETENEMVSIRKEMAMIEKYVDLEKIRLTNPESVSLSCVITNDALIPPMLFMPFIENAFKHSNLNDPNQRLNISIADDKNELLFHCKNTINNSNACSTGNGIGLKLIKERLRLSYPDNYHLVIRQDKGEFCVSLKINTAYDSLHNNRR